MDKLKIGIVLVIVSLFTSCDDGIVMDIVPDQTGYLWLAVNFVEEPVEYPPPPVYGVVGKYDLSKQMWAGLYDTPFNRGRNFDVACGNGRLWLYGAYWDYGDEDYDYKIWEVGTDPNEAFWGGGGGLAYDGSRLWYSHGNTFRTIEPDTHVIEDIFVYTNPRGGSVTGLTWADGMLWAVYNEYSGDNPNSEFMQFDPETGEVLDSFGCIAKEPRGLAWDGEALWTSDYDSQCLYRIDPKTRKVLGNFNPAPIDNYWDEDESLYICGLAFGEGPPDPQ